MKTNIEKLSEKANVNFTRKHLKCVKETKREEITFKTHGERCQAIGFIEGINANRKALLKDIKEIDSPFLKILPDCERNEKDPDNCWCMSCVRKSAFKEFKKEIKQLLKKGMGK